MSSFTAKQLRVTLTLAGANAVFPGTNSNTLVLTGLRTAAVIQAVARLAPQADVRVYGMLPADMNALTLAFFKPIILNNAVVVEANDGSGWVQVFSGTMIEAQPDYRGAPDAYFRIQAVTGYYQQINTAPPSSYTGPTDIAVIVGNLATAMGFAFSNSGATGVLQSPYFSGTLFDQLRDACAHANVDFYIQGGTVIICPPQKPQQSAPTVVLNPQSGLIGYPVLERFGLDVDCIFNPAIVGGGKVQISGAIPVANGLWSPYMLTHILESIVPGGAWLSSLKCVPVLS